MDLKISPTLLDSLDWYKDCPQSWKQRAYDDIVAKIRRAPFVETDAIRKGKDFEDTVERVAKSVVAGGEYKGSQHFQSVVAKCVGGIWQTWQRGTVFLGNDYPMVQSVGKLDVLFPVGHPDHAEGHIVDLKTTASYRGAEKYEKGWQHKFYCHWMKIPTFDYIVAEWESGEPDCKDIKDIHVVPCTVDLDLVASSLSDGIRGFFAFLRTHDLWDDYVYVYCKNKR